MAKNKTLSYFTNGILTENPVLRLVLGTCPTLAVTTTFMNGIGMGAAATMVLICSNIVISLLRNIIPQKVRIPAFITVIAGFVSIVQLLVKAYAPSIDKSLGIFLPLIVVNCIILARAEMFASKNSVLPSLLDGLGMGVGFTVTLAIMGLIREIIGTGQIAISESLTIPLTSAIGIEPMLIFILPPGGFFVFGLLIALSNKIAEKQGKKAVENIGCEGCPVKDCCSAKEEIEKEEEKND
ncbi:MAG: electron transport complex subunit E [Ruminococcaceae bacterium]|nr:electron transport complex subunit E [Oscillospiraceae bacterium]